MSHRPHRSLIASLTILLIAGFLAPTASRGQEQAEYRIDEGLERVEEVTAGALEWRYVGPTVGGRGSTVYGDPNDSNVFWFGHSSGGLWKTEDAGAYWESKGEGQFKMGSVGAMAISESHPNVMYVGMGEPNLRDSVSWGDGVYKSTDGGENWRHIGLPSTRNISRVRIHPTNPDIVYVAAIGNPFGPSDARGVFRSINGGETWQRVLFISDVAGVIDLVLDITNPDLLYASSFRFQRRTWQAFSGGEGSGMHVSTNGGNTWTEITDNPGLPAGNLGRIGLAHSAAMPNRISALIDSEEATGLYQSDDRGATWEMISEDTNITVRPFYFFHLYASPADGDELWVLTNKLWQSLDGGENWTQRSGTKDDFHDMWIDPDNPDRMIVTHDGGTMVSLTAGRTWSTPWTQPTTQFYRVEVDNQVPYNLYGNGQDLIGYRVPSASLWGGISNYEMKIYGTGESGGAVPHPDDPDVIYHLAQSSFASGGAPIQRINLATEQYEHINVWPQITFGRGVKDAKYRCNWHLPIVIDPFDSETLYTACEYVFRSTDRGQTWETISPVLTRDDESKQQMGGAAWAPETSGQEVYNSIHRMAASPHEPGVLWTGSDDGLIHVTRDGGTTWSNVSPNFPPDTDVYEIEVSPHDPATVYVAASRYRTANDVSPYLYMTADYGTTWTDLSPAFPAGEITRTIREDPVRQGLLFVGTETGVFGSILGGGRWDRINLNLPRVPVHDIKIKDGDLVIATHGRGFWIMDDITPFRRWFGEIAPEKAFLFAPRTTWRFGRNWWAAYGGGVFGGQKNYFVQNHRPGHTFIEGGIVSGERRRQFLDAGGARPDGVLVYYWLTDESQDVRLEFFDVDGEEIVGFSGDQVSQKPGLNRFVWNMNYPDATPVPGKPPAGFIPMAKPGTYQVRLVANGEGQVEVFELQANPNETWTREDTDARFELWMQLRAVAESANQAVINSRAAVEAMRAEVAGGAGGSMGPEVIEQAAATQLAFENSLLPVGSTLVQIANEPAKLLPKLQTVSHMLYSSEGRPPASAYAVYESLKVEIQAAIDEWTAAAAAARARLGS